MNVLRYTSLETQPLFRPVAGYIALSSASIKLQNVTDFKLADEAMILFDNIVQKRNILSKSEYTLEQLKASFKAIHKDINFTKDSMIIPKNLIILMHPDLIHELTGNTSLPPTEFKETKIKIKKTDKFMLQNDVVVITQEKITKKYTIPPGLYTINTLKKYLDADLLNLSKDRLIIASGKQAVFSSNFIKALTGLPEDPLAGQYRRGEIKLKNKSTKNPSAIFVRCEQIESNKHLMNGKPSNIVAMIPNITEQQTIEFKPYFLEWYQLLSHHHNHNELTFRLTDENNTDITVENIYFTVLINERI